MKNDTLKTSLENLGFKQGARDKNNYYEDLGTPVTGLVYLTRNHENHYQQIINIENHNPSSNSLVFQI